MKTVDRATYQRAYEDSRVAISLVSQNLGSVLAPVAGLADAWCGPASIDANVKAIANNLIVAANAFKKGLCSQVAMPAFNDDPHFVWSDQARVTRISDGLALVFQSFMDYLKRHRRPGRPVEKAVRQPGHDRLRATCPKVRSATRQPTGPTPTPGASNWMYVMSNGYMKPGWFGQVCAPAR